MKRFLLASAALFAMAAPASAQVVVQQPAFISPTVPVDFGNGPMELKVAQGNAFIATSQSSGTATAGGSTTTVVLTAVPGTPPCVGCLISATGLNAGTTVSSISSATITYAPASAAAVTSGTVSWGAACPATPGATLPVQANVGGDIPLYTQSRVCGYAQFAPGAQVLVFPIGAH